MIDNILKRTEILAASISFITLLLIFIAFPYVFGETPVSIIKIGSRNGTKNLIINVLSYMSINIFMNSFILLFLKQKFKWFKGICVGTFISSTLFIITTNLYFELFWRGHKIL